MIYNLAYYFIIFIIFSMFGYLCEVISVSIIDKRINLHRGYFIGPYLPIFGFGSLAILLLLDNYKEDYIALFCLGMIICILLEYVTSFLLELLLGIRLWDYSDKKFNINGRVSINTGLLFGFGSIFVMYVSNNYLYNFINKIPDNVLIIISTVLFVLLIIDFIFSTYIIIKLKNNRNNIVNNDNTEEIKVLMSEEVSKHIFLYKRFIDSFPHIRLDKNYERINRYLEKKRKKAIVDE